MPTLNESVQAFCELLARGESLTAMERFYAPDVCVFENRQLARAGLARCLEFEREALARTAEPPRFKLNRFAVNEQTRVAFLEYTVRFLSPAGRPLRLEEVAVQAWEGDKITSERFYYEGLIDEGEE